MVYSTLAMAARQDLFRNLVQIYHLDDMCQKMSMVDQSTDDLCAFVVFLCLTPVRVHVLTEAATHL